MDNLTGLPALDVLIGMAFLYFLLATVAATVNEAIQTVLNARARTLTQGLEMLLGDPKEAKAFFEEWRIKQLAKPASRLTRWVQERKYLGKLFGKVPDHRRPSYIPARTFALALLERWQRPEEKNSTEGEPPAVAEESTEETGSAAVREGVARLLNNAELGLDAKRAELERAFDDVMDRASGWYKRYVQWWLLFIALLVSIGLNVNSFTVAERLWKDDALRTSVVQQAQKAVGEGTTVTKPAQANPEVVAKQIDKIEQLKLPIGRTEANSQGKFLGRLAGWLVTALAITLGAPFWFDVLGKVARVRASGNREATAKEANGSGGDS